MLAVNYSGDSDSTGAMTGNILGAFYGVDAIPQRWLGQLKMREIIEQVARDLFDTLTRRRAPDWQRYPPN